MDTAVAASEPPWFGELAKLDDLYSPCISPNFPVVSECIVFRNNRCFIRVLIKIELRYLKERFFFGSANNNTGRDPKLQVCVKSSILCSSEVPFEIIINEDVHPDGLSENIQLKLIQNVEYE